MSKHETPYQKMEDSTRPKMPQRAVTERVRSAPPPLSASTSVRTLMRMTSALENDHSRRDPHATTPRQRVMRRSFTSRQLNPLVRAARSLVWLTPVEEETFRCHICFDDIRVTEAIVLSSCGHRYCKPCFKPYLELKITEGNVYPVCFHPVETAQGAPGTLTNESAPTTTCGVAVEVSDIEEIVGPEIWKKYEYFRFNKEHQHARDCPFCSHSQDCVGPENPVCVCEQCNKTFCFFHGNAHENSSCADYELKTAQEESLNRAKIDEIAKPCPGCHRDVEKKGGCNHMKCVGCNTSFCWLCGEIIEDTPTPSHYAEGAGSCSGKQFEGMEDEGPGCRAILIILFLTVVTFIPATLIALVLAPFVWLFFRLKGVGGSWRFGRVFSKIQSTAMIILCTLVMLVLIPVLWVIDLCLLPFAFLAFLISDCCCSDRDEDDDSDGADPLASPPDLEASLTEELEGGMATEPQETAEKRAVYAV